MIEGKDQREVEVHVEYLKKSVLDVEGMDIEHMSIKNHIMR
jgi:hypothetical protein